MDERLERNKEAIRRLTQSFNDRDRAAFDSGYTEEIVVHASNGSERRMDHDAHWREVQGMLAPFPDLNATIEMMMAEGDRVFVAWTYRGSHTGKGLLEPTGKSASWAVWCVYRLEEGRVAEAWNVHDVANLYTQLGVTELPRRKQPADAEAAS